MFTEIRRLMENPRCLVSALISDRILNPHQVSVLIDEVESLTAARKAGGSEPSDAIRSLRWCLGGNENLFHPGW